MEKKMVESIYIVLLHYQVLEETEECINSILEYNHENVNIVVVDNASPNHSGVSLQKKYDTHPLIHILHCEENLGFAKGNNVGYKFAKGQGADFIIQANNDTYFKDPDFIKKALQIFKKEHYGVLGPNVISTDDQIHQNPAHSFILTAKNIKRQLLKAYMGCILSKVGIDIIVKKAVQQIRPIDQKYYSRSTVITANDNLLLHGSCWIFSPLYIRAFDGMYDGTFMYYEEDILKYLCLRKKLKLLYSPELYIYHRRKSATTAATGSGRKKRHFFYLQSIKSLSTFLDLYKQGGSV